MEQIWDKMWRSTINYGRKGLPLQAISAVDLAIWDLLGKLRNEPVWALLGGMTKERCPVYCTTARPDLVKKMGFAGAKIPCPYGPADGDEGFRKNVEFFAKCMTACGSKASSFCAFPSLHLPLSLSHTTHALAGRKEVGPDFPLMLDCYMAMNVPYTIKLAKALAPLGLKWIEEFLPPDDYDGYKEVREALKGTGVLTTTGEHEYTRYGFRKLIQDRAVDVLQPDITWLGGLTEARRVVAMAAAYDIPVVPHGSSVYSYHLQYAFANCPLAEFITLSPNADAILPYFGGLFPDEPLPKDGFIDLPDRPGFGVTLCRDGLRRPYPRTPAQSAAQAKFNKEKPQPTVPRVRL